MVTIHEPSNSALLNAFANNPFDREPLHCWTFAERMPADRPIDFVPPVQDLAGQLPSSVVRAGDTFVLSFADLARFQVDFSRRSVDAFDIDPATTRAALAHFLFDHVAPRILAHLGYLVLHGSAVEIDGRVAIFLGETGAGKSTLATSLHRAGHTLLGDDAVVVTRDGDRMMAAPVYPSLRLNRDSIASLLGPGTPTAAMAHYSDKQRVDLAELAQPPAAPMPIAALFFLSGDADELTLSRPTPSAACIALLEQSFALDPGDAQGAAARLASASRLVERVPAFALEVPHAYEQLGEVHEAIAGCLVPQAREER